MSYEAKRREAKERKIFQHTLFKLSNCFSFRVWFTSSHCFMSCLVADWGDRASLSNSNISFCFSSPIFVTSAKNFKFFTPKTDAEVKFVIIISISCFAFCFLAGSLLLFLHYKRDISVYKKLQKFYKICHLLNENLHKNIDKCVLQLSFINKDWTFYNYIPIHYIMYK